MDPIVTGALVGAGSDLLGSYLQGQQGQYIPPSFSPQDQYGSSRLQLGPESQQEQLLALLQQSLFRNTASAFQGGMPQELSFGNLARGELPQANQQRIDKIAFGGLDRGLQQAQALAGESALSRGVGLSSIEGVQAANLQQPLIESAGRMSAELQMGELQRLQSLNQQFLGNAMALENSPALQRLTQLRLATGEQQQLDLLRAPGELPKGMGPQDMRSRQEKMGDVHKELFKYNEDLMARGYPKHKRNKMVNEMRKKLAAQYGFTVGDNYEIIDPQGGA